MCARVSHIERERTDRDARKIPVRQACSAVTVPDTNEFNAVWLFGCCTVVLSSQ